MIQKERRQVLLSLSGGMDSATLVGHYLEHPFYDYQVHCACFQYGSKHNEHEKKAVVSIYQHYQEKITSVRFVYLSNLIEQLNIESNLLISGGSIPEGHYQEENMRRTVVPGRNSLFVSMLLAMGQSIGVDTIAVGVHSGDHHIYPDCRPDWYNAAAKMVLAASDGSMILEAPFLHGNKTTILKEGYSFKHKTPYELTRTCYTQNEIACGKCGACQERLEAFSNIGMVDPLPYQ